MDTPVRGIREIFATADNPTGHKGMSTITLPRLVDRAIGSLVDEIVVLSKKIDLYSSLSYIPIFQSKEL